MEIHYCDICNKKLEKIREVIFYEVDEEDDSNNRFSKEVCQDCFREINRLVNELKDLKQHGG